MATIPIADLRDRTGLTQQQLADVIGVKRTTLSHYETGRSRVPVDLLPTIKTALGCTWDELFGEEDGNDETADLGGDA